MVLKDAFLNAALHVSAGLFALTLMHCISVALGFKACHPIDWPYIIAGACAYLIARTLILHYKY